MKTLQDVRLYLNGEEKRLREELGQVIEKCGICSVEAIAAKEAWQVMYTAAFEFENERGLNKCAN